MRSSITSLIFLPIIAFVLYKIVTLVTTKYKHAKLAESLGCSPAPVYPGKLILMLNFYDLVQ